MLLKAARPQQPPICDRIRSLLRRRPRFAFDPVKIGLGANDLVVKLGAKLGLCPASPKRLLKAAIGLAGARASYKPGGPFVLGMSPPMRLGLMCLAVSAAVVVAFWAWLGTPVQMPHTPLAPGEKLYCLSYAPFRPGQSPFDPAVHITVRQIDEDLALLSRITDCVRTYSVELGQDEVAAVAKRHRMKVIQGIWIGNNPEKNRQEIETSIRIANQYPDVVQALVVGNEVLLRGEMGADELGGIIREVKARVKQPVTYADVWEFWLRNPSLAADVDFITIHILPYWEDFPISADEAAAHVDAIRRRVVAAFPGKEVLIGEVGWPSEGRMRAGALPSPANQARVIQDVLALAKRENFHVNVIEAFDQPWKRVLEGTVGGHWGLLDDYSRAFKFSWGEAVSNHPQWKLQAAGGVAFAVLIFAVAFYAQGGVAGAGLWLVVAVNAIAGGSVIGWAIANVPLESLGAGGWLRSLALATVALTAPPLLSAATMRRTAIPPFWRIIGPGAERARDPLSFAIGALLIVLTLLAIPVALGLVFNPRYLDFPFTPLTAAAVPFLTHSLTLSPAKGSHPTSELASAGVLALSVPYIALNEGLNNWQSLWLCAALIAVAVTLARVRGAQS
jgi:exo-beta-1,3-glucanase (GH17 family)